MKSFRVYADGWRDVRHAYVQVRVFDTRAQMHRDINDCDFGPSGDCHGQCSGLTHYNRAGRMTGRFACMWLNRDDLRANASEIVAHESVHAAMRHMANKRINVHDRSDIAGACSDSEEALAYTVGWLTRSINDRLHEIGVFAPGK